MSIYYYLVCHTHMTGVAACSSVACGSPMGDGLDLPAFIYEHKECVGELEIQSEHMWADARDVGYQNFKRDDNGRRT